MTRGPLLERLGIRYPIIAAPMAGGPSTPEFVAAVSNAGGLGSLGVAYLPADRIRQDIARIRALTSQPFNVNLFAGGYATEVDRDPRPMLELMAGIHARFGLPAPEVPALPANPFPEQLEVILETRPAVFSFTFGIPDNRDIARLKDRGIVVLGTATTVHEAQLLEAAGVDAVVAQGAEAGAHRGTFAGSFEDAMIPALELVRQIAARAKTPVIAAGGIMDGRDIAAALAAGASAVQMGTAFLVCPESGTFPAHKQAILSAAADTTLITRAFSGRQARGLANEFTRLLQEKEDWILPYPLQNSLTTAMRRAAAAKGDPQYLSLWAGKGVTRARALPAAELVQQLVREMEAAAG